MVEQSGKLLAVIRLRGRTGISYDVELTLKHLNLNRINNCIVVSESPRLIGMLRKAKDFITWGAIDSETLTSVASKRGKHVDTVEGKNGKHHVVNVDGKNYESPFRLSPAKGGLGSRGIKASFKNSGALGDRKEKINELIKKML